MAYTRVVGLGLCVADHVYLVDDFSLAATRTRYRERVESPGGMVATALGQVAALGVPAQLVSLLGDDPTGHRVADTLRALGVDTGHLLHAERFATGVAVVLVHRDSGERRFLVADRRELEAGAPALPLPPLDSGSILLVDGHFSRSALAAVQQARGCGALVVGDFSDARDSFVGLLPWIDHAIVPAEFVAAFGAGDPEETLRALHGKYGGEPVVTLGARGALAWIGGQVRRIPAVPAHVRDTTGAGDVFHGAFAAGMCRGLEVEGALRLASRAAAVCCEGLGGVGRLLRAEDL